eukprot:2092987-Rhodomonas_salina.3
MSVVALVQVREGWMKRATLTGHSGRVEALLVRIQPALRSTFLLQFTARHPTFCHQRPTCSSLFWSTNVCHSADR